MIEWNLELLSNRKERYVLDWESVKFMVSLFAMMAAVGASIAANVNANTAKNNLNEVKENNRRAVRPFLIIRSKEIDLCYESDKPGHKINWDTKAYDLKSFSMDSVSYLEMANISNGVAKNVVVKFTIKNAETVIDATANHNSLDPYLIIKLYKDANEFQPDKQALYVNYRTQGNKAFGNDMFNLVHSPIKQFIAVEKGENYKIILPPAFMALYNTIFQLSLDFKTENLPYLEIAIELEDIIGNPYKFIIN